MAQQSNSHYAPQPYINQSIFKSLLNCTSEMSLSHNATGREFQRHGPATEKLSPRPVRVLFVAHVKTSADCSDRRPMSVKSWQSSARYCGSWPCNALCTTTANLKSMRCQLGQMLLKYLVSSVTWERRCLVVYDSVRKGNITSSSVIYYITSEEP